MVRQPTARRGFTLVQLLFIIAFLLFLFGILVSAVGRVRQVADQTSSQNSLKQLALACHSFNDVFRRLPPTVGKAGETIGTCHFHLLPFVEEDNLFKRGEGSVWKNGVNGVVIPWFLNASDKSAGPDHKFQDWLATTNFACNWLTFKTGENRIPASFPDGTSNTLIFAERYQICNGVPTAWGYATLYTWAPMFGYYSHGKFQSAPSQDECDPTLPQSIDPAGISVALGDASSRRVSPSISPETWWYVTDPADGMVLGPDWND
ncbi:MAG: DUF1559 domain-containing protein [Planctomycetes bacterium]|nr:DUF1559 domain-containing protein [Planctomycetota bacterium]